MNELDPSSVVQLGPIAVLALVLNVVGRMVKGIPHVPNWLIPLILPSVGAVLFPAWQGWGVEGALQGFLAGAGAVWGNQTWRQLTGYQPNAPKPPTQVHLALVAALSVALLTGCQTPFESVVFKTLETSKVAVTLSTQAYGDICRAKAAAGTPCPDAEIRQAYEAFELWKQYSLATAEALKTYLIIKAQVGANLATPAEAEAAKAQVSTLLNETTRTQTTIQQHPPKGSTP